MVATVRYPGLLLILQALNPPLRGEVRAPGVRKRGGYPLAKLAESSPCPLTLQAGWRIRPTEGRQPGFLSPTAALRRQELAHSVRGVPLGSCSQPDVLRSRMEDRDATTTPCRFRPRCPQRQRARCNVSSRAVTGILRRLGRSTCTPGSYESGTIRPRPLAACSGYRSWSPLCTDHRTWPRSCQ
jgi:hypothetical protein